MNCEIGQGLQIYIDYTIENKVNLLGKAIRQGKILTKGTWSNGRASGVEILKLFATQLSLRAAGICLLPTKPRTNSITKY